MNEQRGIALLVLLLCISLGVRFWPLPKVDYDIQFVYADADSATNPTKDIVKKNRITRQHIGWRLESFDVNYAKARELRNMGFSNEFISAWFSNKQEIGFITSWNDFEALGLMNGADLQRVKPFLDFSRYEKRTPKKVNKQKSKIPTLFLNTADSTDLKQLPGIGNKFSKRIVKYRDKLGGFYKKDQLLEVYGIDSLLFLRISLYLSQDSVFRKIDINNATVQTLQAHPYITYKQANAIVKYREQHGVFHTITDLRQIYVLDDQWLQKIKPYLYID